jgi:nicotinamidase-related amidase
MDPFEDHCWKDVIPADILAIYRSYIRPVSIGPAPALLMIDQYNLAFAGGARPVIELQAEHPSSCGEHGWAALDPTQRLLAQARASGIPIFYTTQETRPEALAARTPATLRRNTTLDPAGFAIFEPLAPLAGEVVIYKQRASAFYGTPLHSHLTQLGIRSLIVAGETTSGCVRASVVDAYSHGYRVSIAEECCFDRSPISHKVSLFDLHHKYADVLHAEEVMAHLARMGATRRG